MRVFSGKTDETTGKRGPAKLLVEFAVFDGVNPKPTTMPTIRLEAAQGDQPAKADFVPPMGASTQEQRRAFAEAVRRPEAIVLRDALRAFAAEVAPPGSERKSAKLLIASIANAADARGVDLAKLGLDRETVETARDAAGTPANGAAFAAGVVEAGASGRTSQAGRSAARGDIEQPRAASANDADREDRKRKFRADYMSQLQSQRPVAAVRETAIARPAAQAPGQQAASANAYSNRTKLLIAYANPDMPNQVLAEQQRIAALSQRDLTIAARMAAQNLSGQAATRADHNTNLKRAFVKRGAEIVAAELEKRGLAEPLLDKALGIAQKDPRAAPASVKDAIQASNKPAQQRSARER